MKHVLPPLQWSLKCRSVAAQAKFSDSTRPVTIALNANPKADYAVSILIEMMQKLNGVLKCFVQFYIIHCIVE